MDWTLCEGDYLAAAPAYGAGVNIYVAQTDGELRFAGPDWKECPRTEKPCPRSAHETSVPCGLIGLHLKCRTCTWNGMASLGTQDTAMRVAEIAQAYVAGDETLQAQDELAEALAVILAVAKGRRHWRSRDGYDSGAREKSGTGPIGHLLHR